MMMKILILEPYPEIDPQYLSYLQDQGHDLIMYGEAHDPTNINAVVIRSKTHIDDVFISQYPSLRYILRVGVGTDKIDTQILKEKNIILINTPAANAHSVAELAVRGMISLLRKTKQNWRNASERFNFMGQELHGKNIGLIGFGNIARIVYKILQAFDPNHFFVYDPYIDSEKYTAQNLTFVSKKEEIFSQSDIISFHIPLTSETKNFLAQEHFNVLKKSVKIINTSRGGIVDELALLNFLSENEQAGAYFDTREEEPNQPKKELLQLSNCIVTPHIGAMTEEAAQKMHTFVF